MRQKIELRQRMLKTRENIQDIEHKNMLVFRQFTEFVEKFLHKKIFSYVSMQSEVDTKKIISYYIDRDNFSVYVPNTEATMTLHKLLSADKLSPNKYGNIHPSQIESQKYEGRVDLAIVPLLAFDKGLRRLGYGGGYYDRYLSNSDVFSLGLAFDEQEVDALPFEEHDIPLSGILTPTRFLSGSKRIFTKE